MDYKITMRQAENNVMNKWFSSFYWVMARSITSNSIPAININAAILRENNKIFFNVIIEDYKKFLWKIFCENEFYRIFIETVNFIDKL